MLFFFLSFFFFTTHTTDFPPAFQIASEITFAQMELRWQAGIDGGGGGRGGHCSHFHFQCERFVVFETKNSDWMLPDVPRLSSAPPIKHTVYTHTHTHTHTFRWLYMHVIQFGNTNFEMCGSQHTWHKCVCLRPWHVSVPSRTRSSFIKSVQWR